MEPQNGTKNELNKSYNKFSFQSNRIAVQLDLTRLFGDIMKKYFALLTLILIGSIPSLAQPKAPNAPEDKKPLVTEDKFDPGRDSVADLKATVTRTQAEVNASC
jgi:hypothetical protein